MKFLRNKTGGTSGTGSWKRQRVYALIVVIFALVVGSIISRNLGVNDLIGGNEGYYGVMARNILEDPSYIINTSLSPLGEPGDKPPLYPLILSGALRLGGIDEIPLRLVSVIASLLTGVLLFFTVRMAAGRRPGLLSGIIYLSTPLLANTGRHVAAEPVLLMFSMAGVFLFMLGCRRNSLVPAFISGILFAAGFLCKLWLALLPAFGVVAGMIIFELTAGRHEKWNFRIIPMLLSIAAGFIVLAPIQFVLCAIFSPATLRHWINIYFGFSLASRTTGTGFASYWIQPWHFYLMTLGRAMALYLPLIIAGIFSFGKIWKRSPTAMIVFAWLLPLIPMSVIPVKSGAYILPLVPPAAILAASGLDLLLSSDRRFSRYGIFLSAGIALIAAVITQIRLTEGEVPAVNNYPLFAIQIVWVLILLSALVSNRPVRSGLSFAAIMLFLLTAAAGLYRDLQICRQDTHDTGYELIARAAAPMLEEIDPKLPCFFSPEWPSISFYTFRTGSYWQSPYDDLNKPEIINSIDSGDPFLYIMGDPGSGLYGDLENEDFRRLIRAQTIQLEYLPAGEKDGVEARMNWSMAGRI